MQRNSHPCIGTPPRASAATDNRVHNRGRGADGGGHQRASKLLSHVRSARVVPFATFVVSGVTMSRTVVVRWLHSRCLVVCVVICREWIVAPLPLFALECCGYLDRRDCGWGGHRLPPQLRLRQRGRGRYLWKSALYSLQVSLQAVLLRLLCRLPSVQLLCDSVSTLGFAI
jgi:hypothetical protein